MSLRNDGVVPVDMDSLEMHELYSDSKKTGSVARPRKKLFFVPTFFAAVAFCIFVGLLKQRLHQSADSTAKALRVSDIRPPATISGRWTHRQLPAQYDEWGLPTIAHFEETLSPTLKQGKDAIAQAIAHSESKKSSSLSVDPANRQHLAARTLSNDKSDSLLGMTLELEDVVPFKRRAENKPVPSKMRITKVVGSDPSGLLVLAEDVKSRQLYTMRVCIMQAPLASEFPDSESLFETISYWNEIDDKVVSQISKSTPEGEDDSQQIATIPIYTANVAGATDATVINGSYVFGQVYLLEELHGSMQTLDLKGEELLPQTHEYIGSRLLQVFLKLQKAGISSAAVDWSNIFVRPDGSFVVSGFRSSSPFGWPYGPFAAFNLERSEPQLVLSIFRSLETSESCVSHPAVDMWLLGTLLYELFTKGESAYGMDEWYEMEDSRKLAKGLLERKTRSEVLRPQLEAANVPERWLELILRLLEPERVNRITAFGIMKEFPDLAQHISHRLSE